MAPPAWPIASFQPVPDSFQPIQRMLDPISTDMEGGNTRQRPRPGEHDHESLPERARREAAAGIALVVGGFVLTLDPEDAHVAADRKGADLVLGVAELDAEQRPAVADREPEDLDVEKLGREEVAELVDDDEHTDEEKEVQDRHETRPPRL